MPDTGPTYPRINLPDSNFIGRGGFIIGVSPIGTIPSFDPWATIIFQYSDSPIITALIADFAECLDNTALFDEFFDDIWSVLTATGYGLTIWGEIVGVSRVVSLAAGAYFGMEGPAGASGDPYDVSPFFDGEPLTNNFSLTDDAFRILILAKALSNISDGSIKSINQILLNLFPGRGNAYVTDGLDMTMTYTFTFALSTVELAILEQSGVLPKPVGVSATIVQI